MNFKFEAKMSRLELSIEFAKGNTALSLIAASSGSFFRRARLQFQRFFWSRREDFRRIANPCFSVCREDAKGRRWILRPMQINALLFARRFTAVPVSFCVTMPTDLHLKRQAGLC
jgi:hypothetical protein